MRPDLKFDKRLVYRHIKLGLLKADELDQFNTALPDVLGQAAPLKVDVDNVGVSDVERKDAGDTDD